MPTEITAPITITSVNITAPITLGYVGKSAYQSYLATTSDDPPMTEEEWASATGTGGGEAYQSATAPDPAIHPFWFNTGNGALYQWHGTPPAGVWVNVSHEEELYEGQPVFALGDSYAVEGGDVCAIPTYTAAAAAGYTAGHPSVVYFPNGFGGYKYWMAHTPLKGGGTADYENPCIVASNDGVTWETPMGITNPIQPKPASGFNADANLTWDGEKFILIYTEFATNYTIYYLTSADGITWTAPVAMLANVSTVKRTASPSLRSLPDGTFQLWAVNDVASPNEVSLYTAADLTGPWTETACTYSRVIGEPWHQEVHFYRGQYVMLMNTVDAFTRYQLLFLTSANGIAWTLNQKFPYAIGWNGQAGTSSYYKSACVFSHGLGDGVVGKLWHTTSDWAQTRVSEIYSDSDLSISPTYVADSPLAISAPYVIGDNFNRANGDLTGTNASTGQTWLVAAANKIQIDTNKIKMGAANSYAAIDTGVEDGMIGMRLSTFPYAGTWEFEARSKRAGAGSNIKRIGIYWVSKEFRLQVYNGSATVILAKFSPAFIDSFAMDGTEITLEFRARVVTVRMNGRVIMLATMSESDAASLVGNTQASLYMGDADTRIDRFFAQS